MDAPYTDTTGKLARDAGHDIATVRRIADEGLLDFTRASDGTRLFRAGQAQRVRELVAERIARRGRPSAARG